MEVELDQFQLLLLQKDVEMEQLELFGLNSKILYTYQMEMLQPPNIQHYSLRMVNSIKMRTR